MKGRKVFECLLEIADDDQRAVAISRLKAKLLRTVTAYCFLSGDELTTDLGERVEKTRAQVGAAALVRFCGEEARQ